jgi:quercetin dioxygenase-like cupin family protein
MSKPVSHRVPGEGATVRLGPTEYLTDLVSGEETEGHYTIYEVMSAQDGGVPLHEHDWDEGFYVLEGEYEISYLGTDDEIQHVVAGPGAFVHVPGGAAHAYRNTAEGFSKMLSINQPVGLQPIVRKFGLPCSAPGVEPESEPIPVEEFRAGFRAMGVRVVEARLAETARGAWQDATPGE